MTNKWHREHSISGNWTPFLTGNAYDGTTVVFAGMPMYSGGGNIACVDGHAKWVKMSDSSGRPTVCSTLPWVKAIDPQQRGADDTASYCGGKNPLPGGWSGPQWF